MITKGRIEFGHLNIGPIAWENLRDCYKTNWASQGPKVQEFETKWGALFGYQYNKAVSSGTDAVLNLISSLYRYGAKRGDEVIVPALSFIATSNAVLQAGFTPVFVDVEKNTLNIDPRKIEEKITDKTRGILVVHTMGCPCEMDELIQISANRNLFLFEDACEAHGASYKGNYIGTESYGAAFSFYIAHLICCGEGGMVSTNQSSVSDSISSTRSHGRRNGKYFDHTDIGYNSKMNDLEASLGLEGINEFWNIFEMRKENLYTLMNAMDKNKKYAWFNEEPEHMKLCPHAFSIVLKNKRKPLNRLTNILDKEEIHWKRNFGCIPTQHKAYEWMGYKLGDFPNAEHIGDYGIHIGVHQYLSDDDLNRIIDSLNKYFKENY